MNQTLSETLVPPAARTFDDRLVDGPLLEVASPGTHPVDQPLLIRARRSFPVSRQELFAAWTRRTAWDSWMRLRARSRTSLAPYRGGAFRLELAEGPTIHVITGAMIDIRPHELLSLSWIHQNASDQGSTVDITFHKRQDGSDLSLVHRAIANRREAAWLMRLWASVLVRLEDYLAEASAKRRQSEVATPIAAVAEPELHHRRARAASSAA